MHDTDVRTELFDDEIKRIEDDILPDGFFSDGVENDSEGFYDGEDRWFDAESKNVIL
jgi:hypothetical protein